MKTLTITNLEFKSETKSTGPARELSKVEMTRVQGGRKIAVLVDGRPGGVVDDFQLNLAIFRGDIGVKVV